MKEVWKDIKGFEGLYSISNLGFVYSIMSNTFIKSFKSKLGYHDVYLYLATNNKRKIKKLHRLVALAFLENKQNLKEVNHKDGNKDNNIVSNLEWISRSDNMKHAFKNKLWIPRKGKDNNKTKLTEKEVLEIRNMRTKGEKYKIIAKKFNVTIANIFSIIKRQTWKELKNE